jgi:methionyl-tRNA formyltransferase
VLPLDKIAHSHHNILAVVTAPDKPAGRGRKLRKSAVKEYAEANDLTVLQPEKLRDPHFVEELTNLQPDLIVVVAFRMLPEVVWQIPKIGTFNLHASLLPQYRGAAPINWAIINGESETGVTTFFINEQIDTGSILLQAKMPIAADETAGTLHDKLMHLGADLVLETVNGLAEDNLESQPQDDSAKLTPAPKIFKDDCRIDWRKHGAQVEQLIRGLSPYPGAFTIIDSGELAGQLKIQEAKYVPDITKQLAGTLEIAEKEIHIHVVDGYLNIVQLQPQGKRKMSAQDVINGIQNKQNLMRCTS